MVYLILQAEDPESAAKNGVGALLATVTVTPYLVRYSKDGGRLMV
jgi:hypothetical protein